MLPRVDVVFFLFLPFGARLQQEFLPPRLAVFFPLNLLLPVLLFLALENLSARDVELATGNRCQEPLEEFTETYMVLLNFFRVDTLNDPLAVRQRLVRHDLPPLRLPVHLIVQHGLRDLVSPDLSDPLPAEFVGLRQADGLPMRASQEHQTLDDLGVALHAILEHVLDHFDPFLIFQELVRHYFKSLILVLNLGKLLVNSFSRRRLRWLLAFFNRLGELFVEVDGVSGAFLELKIFDLGYDVLSHESFILRGRLSVDFQSLQLPVPIAGQSDTLLFFPDLNETLDRCQGKLLLLDSQLAVLAHRVHADDVLLVLCPEVVQLDDGPLFLFWLEFGTLGLGSLPSLLLSIFKCFHLALLLLKTLLIFLPVGDGFG